MSRYRRHKDTAHPAIVKALLEAGALVVVLEQARWAGGGRKQSTAGAPDIIATLAGITVALEVKTPGTAKRRREDPDQEAFRCAAAVHGMDARQVETPAQALAAIGARQRPKPALAYVPPRTDHGQCEHPGGCTRPRYTHDSRFCGGHHAEALFGRAAATSERSSRKAGAKETP